MGEAHITVQILGRIDVHQQRDDADRDQHHRCEAVDERAHLELHATDLEPGDGAHDRGNRLVSAAVFTFGGCMALGTRGGMGGTDGLARITGGGVDLFPHRLAGLRGEPIGLHDVGGERLTGGWVVDPTHPVARHDHRQDEAHGHRGDTDAGSGSGAPALAEEQDHEERGRHDGGDDPDLVDHVEHEDQPFSMSTSSMSMLCRLR